MRYKKINPEYFTGNRRKLIEKLEKRSVAVIYSNDQMVRSGDQYFPYRQNADLFYLSGIEQEMSVLIISTDQQPGIRLFIRKPDPKLEVWEGKKLDQKGAEEISGIVDVHWLDEFDAILAETLKNAKNIYSNIPELEKFKPEYPLRSERMMIGLKKEYPSYNILRLAPLMTELRLVKEDTELELIREAVRITAAGYERILRFIRPGLYEYEIEAELTHEFIRQGAGGHAYPPIIASGGNACFLHYISNDKVCRDGHLLLMDFGAEYANYAADCTRTVPVNGRFSKRQREIYDACLRIFRAARSLLKPGETIEKINEAVGKLWEEEHVGLGLYSTADLKKQTEKDPLHKKYFMHGTSHFVGLDVHDVGSKQVKLSPGMVLTCEPGIYIPEEGIGIRLENDILITPEGNIDLMKDFPIESEQIEELMKNP